MPSCLVLSPIATIPTELENEIAERVMMAFRNSGYRQLLELAVRVHGHEVCLRGNLPSYYLKQMAHYVASAVPGVQGLIDDIDVVN